MLIIHPTRRVLMKLNSIILCLVCSLFLCSCSQPSKPEEKTHFDSKNISDTASEEDLNSQKDKKEEDQSADTIQIPIPLKAQETNYYCAVACLQMVLDYHGVQVSQTDLAKALNTDPVTGTEYEDLAREASLRIFGNWPLDDSQSGYRYLLWNRNQGTDQTRAEFERRVRDDLKSGDPMFISINPAVVYADAADAVHEIVLYGADYDQEGNAVRYYCLDPYQNYWESENEGRKVFTPDELWNAMNDNPEPGYVW